MFKDQIIVNERVFDVKNLNKPIQCLKIKTYCTLITLGENYLIYGMNNDAKVSIYKYDDD